jgi:hypothetical protein
MVVGEKAAVRLGLRVRHEGGLGQRRARPDLRVGDDTGSGRRCEPEELRRGCRDLGAELLQRVDQLVGESHSVLSAPAGERSVCGGIHVPGKDAGKIDRVDLASPDLEPRHPGQARLQIGGHQRFVQARCDRLKHHVCSFTYPTDAGTQFVRIAAADVPVSDGGGDSAGARVGRGGP